jgi:mono/diheme cytochrome c family protein
MYAHDDQDLREYILDGAPAKKLARDAYRAEIEAQAIRMPAYRSVVSGRQVDLLVAFLRSASDLIAPADEPAAHGAELAARNGCFACHGEMGSGGLPNRLSKGYIGFFVRLRGLVPTTPTARLDRRAASRACATIRARLHDRQRIQMPPSPI